MSEFPLNEETLEEWLGPVLEDRKKRIRIQSKEVASYIESNKDFYDWFGELEGFAFREERFWDDCESCRKSEMFEWVRWAFHIGWEAGRKHHD